MLRHCHNFIISWMRLWILQHYVTFLKYFCKNKLQVLFWIGNWHWSKSKPHFQNASHSQQNKIIFKCFPAKCFSSLHLLKSYNSSHSSHSHSTTCKTLTVCSTFFQMLRLLFSKQNDGEFIGFLQHPPFLDFRRRGHHSFFFQLLTSKTVAIFSKPPKHFVCVSQ